MGSVFVGVHYAEGLSRLFQSGLTQIKKAFNVCYGSKADSLHSVTLCPLCPRKRTCSASNSMSALCHKPTLGLSGPGEAGSD